MFEPMIVENLQSRSACTEGKTCPQVLDDPEPGMQLVQGYLASPETVARVAPPAGEGLVRVPRALLISKAREFELDDLFDACTRTAFRLETLPRYLVEQEAEWLEAFRRERVLPRRTVETSPWLRYVAETTAAGRHWQRVHVVTRPLSTYLEFELLTYRDNAAAGEDIRIADRTAADEAGNAEAADLAALDLAALDQDFWLLDAGAETAAAVLLRYDGEGRYLGFEISTDRDVLARCQRQRDLALACSMPLEQYLVRMGPAPVRVA
jgi:hypothetical protein